MIAGEGQGYRRRNAIVCSTETASRLHRRFFQEKWSFLSKVRNRHGTRPTGLLSEQVGTC